MQKSIYIADFTKLDKIQHSDVSVSSAIIEHIDEWHLFLEKMLNSTNKLIIIRTFLGEVTKREEVRADGASRNYPIWQFGFNEFLTAISQLGWKPEVKKDVFTDSMPIFNSYGKDNITGITRTQFVIVCKKF